MASRSAVLASLSAALGEHRIFDGVCVACEGAAVRALTAALDEISRLRHVRTEAGARKYGLPIGSVIGGSGSPYAPSQPAAAAPKPRPTRTSAKDRLAAALDSHLKGESVSDPFDGYTRDHLREVAKARGVNLGRGESRESISKKLLADASGAEPTASRRPDAPKSEEAKPALERPRDKPQPAQAVESAPGQSDREQLAHVVNTRKVAHEESFSAGIAGDTRLRVYDDGTKTVWKRSREFRDTGAKHQADAEELAPLVARALGLPAPAVHRMDDATVSMQFVDDAKVYSEWDEPDPDLPDTDEGRMLGLLDLLLSNPDRHRGNMMIRNSDGGIVPIDHGLAWHDLAHDFPELPARRMKSPYANHFFTFTYNHQGLDRNDLTKADFAALRTRIEALAPAFKAAGRPDWHQFMTERLDAMAEYASGTKSRLLPEIP